MPKDASPLLVDRVRDFFARISADGTLRILLDRYYGHIQRLNQGDVSAFLERRLSVLPQYRNIFQEAQELTGIDWRLLAALGFQESHWNPLATSPTGVRGLMMLTSETADRLGRERPPGPSPEHHCRCALSEDTERHATRSHCRARPHLACSRIV